MILQLLLFAGLLAVLHFAWSKRRLIYANYQMGGPIPYPFIGSAHLVMDPNKTVETCFKMIEKYGNIFAVWAGWEMYVCVASADGVADVLRNPNIAVKGISYTFLERLMGRGLFTFSGAKWSFYRKHINPTFKYSNHQLLMPTINKHARTFVQCLEKKISTNKEAFDMRPIAARYVIDVIMDTLMDQDVGIQQGKNPKFTSALNTVMHIIGQRIFNPLLQPMALYRWSSKHAIEAEQIDTIVNPFVINNIETHMANESVTLRTDDKDESPRYVKDLVRLCKIDGKFSYEEVVDNSKTMIIAAYDTTCSAMSFLTLMLAMRPECQQRIYEEIIATGLSETHDWTMDDLAKLEYFDRFVKETLRLFPSGAYVERTTNDYMKIGGYDVPPGAQIVVGLLHVHRSPEHYANPNLFDPDHFLPEQMEGRHPFAYVPFSHGPRVCIGTRYAYATLRVAAVKVLRHFTLSTTLKMEELKLRFDVTLNCQNGYMVSMETRK